MLPAEYATRFLRVDSLLAIIDHLSWIDLNSVPVLWPDAANTELDNVEFPLSRQTVSLNAGSQTPDLGMPCEDAMRMWDPPCGDALLWHGAAHLYAP